MKRTCPPRSAGSPHAYDEHLGKQDCQKGMGKRKGQHVREDLMCRSFANSLENAESAHPRTPVCSWLRELPSQEMPCATGSPQLAERQRTTLRICMGSSDPELSQVLLKTLSGRKRQPSGGMPGGQKAVVECSPSSK